MKPVLGARYPLPLSAYTELLARVSVTRSLWYSWRLRGRVLAGRGSRIRIHRTARVEGPPGWMLVIGMAHDSTPGAVLRMRPRSRLTLGGRVQFMRGTTVHLGYDAHLSVGAGTFVNDGATVHCDHRVEIGADCAISWGVRILDSDVHALLKDGVEQPRHAPVVIGDHCWLGTGATVLKGAELGDHCVAGASAVVTGRFGPGTLVHGVPARAVSKDVSWKH
ncbi:acyltransferase [Kineosporia sp. J2-2]|uniref:Acyltransferase n=1 Tax=Kineosporia corallincola TaxID=2835133 RepID=A0ABS5TLQ8_9ACTN|nr:acyltransferase [Kineosporia corallincola]MBT0772039.1 acyltransferase [Kineosporia corallincola]